MSFGSAIARAAVVQLLIAIVSVAAVAVAVGIAVGYFLFR